MTRILRDADLFCGAGGTSAGAESTGACRVEFAVNHWDVAVQTHSRNFPHTKHVNSRLDLVNPSDCGKIDLLFASPECTHHSRARGGRPTSDQQRSGAWDLMKWLDHHRPNWLVVENVREFEQWGPVHNGRPMTTKRGAFFEAWIAAIRAGGYQVDWRVLNAADFGAATSRERLFVLARKGGKNPVFPEATHCESPGGEFPGMALPRWRPAYEIIDWGIPCPSIFGRKRPLADKTLLRIEAGLRRFVGPFVAQWDNKGRANGGYVRDVNRPLHTLTTKANCGIVVPYQVILRNNNRPAGTVTGKRGESIIVPFLAHYYGTLNCNRADCPLATITTKDRLSLVACELCGIPCGPPMVENATPAMQTLLNTMRELGVYDIGFRMLSNPELAAAQGFEPEYFFAGNKSEVTRQIGNSVSPPNARALTEAIAAA